ncbi:hypothetical protein MRX96_003161 [Rhipicephalus microplus]
MAPPERPDPSGGRSHDVIDSSAASADESYASSASPSTSPAKTNGTASSPRQSISGVGSRQTPPPTICQVYDFPTSPHPTRPRARRI